MSTANRQSQFSLYTQGVRRGDTLPDTDQRGELYFLNTDRLFYFGTGQGWQAQNQVPSYIYLNLPASIVGAVVFVSDGLKQGETTGNGTGVLAYGDGSDWYRTSDDSAVQA